MNAVERAIARARSTEKDASVVVEAWRESGLTVSAYEQGTQLLKAIDYTEDQWTALNRFLEDGRLPLHNNVCESQLRDVALGRQNYLFAGSHRGARPAAIFYSLTRTCGQWGVNPSA